jgi:repressor LexA
VLIVPGRIFNKEIFAQRLTDLMDQHDDTIYSLGEYLHLSPSSISKYRSADMTPKHMAIEKIAEKYGVNPVWLMGANVEKYLEIEEKTKKVPIFVDENILGYEYVLNSVNVDYCLLVKGDSMINAQIHDGNIVFIRQQPDVENGEIAAVMIDREEATLKRVYKINGTVILHPENPKYKDLVYSKKEMKDVRILGKAVFLKAEVR